MSILAWIVFGAFVGWVASLIMNTDERQGALGNIIVGIVGAIIGGSISSLLGGPSVSEFSLMSVMIAILGAVVLLFFIRMLGSGRHDTIER